MPKNKMMNCATQLKYHQRYAADKQKTKNKKVKIKTLNITNLS